MSESKYLKLPENKEGNDYVVGDIHGCFSKLERNLEALGFDKTKDRLLSVGDLIDRGPESEQSFNYLDEPWFYAVAGNHETFLIDYIESENQMLLDCWLRNGGNWIFECDWRSFYNKFKAIPLMMETEVEGKRIGLIHAELPKNEDWDRCKDILDGSTDAYDNSLKPMLIESLQWGRDMATAWGNHEHYNYLGTEFDDSVYNINGIDWIFAGHTPIREEYVPLTIGNNVLIDNGSCFYESRDLCIININEWVKEHSG